jgi:hypothetical protein
MCGCETSLLKLRAVLFPEVTFGDEGSKLVQATLAAILEKLKNSTIPGITVSFSHRSGRDYEHERCFTFITQQDV